MQLLRERGDEEGGGVPILAAVGPLQLEVVQVYAHAAPRTLYLPTQPSDLLLAWCRNS